MEPTVANATTPNERSALRKRAIEMHAAVARTGVIKGASSMAPITTAAESADKPMTATMTDSVVIIANRNPQCSCRLIASSNITRWRSSESRCRCHHTRGRCKVVSDGSWSLAPVPVLDAAPRVSVIEPRLRNVEHESAAPEVPAFPSTFSDTINLAEWLGN